jgi:hypothetical protein
MEGKYEKGYQKGYKPYQKAEYRDSGIPVHGCASISLIALLISYSCNCTRP